MSLERFESVAQGHAVRAPVIFDRALPFQLLDEKGNSYIDFSSGGYGHNNLGVHTALIDHLSREQIIQACDRTSVVRRRFVEAFAERILHPRRMTHRILFTDPASGTAAETALKLARRGKRRTKIVAFTGASHKRQTSQHSQRPHCVHPAISPKTLGFRPLMQRLGGAGAWETW